MPNPSTLAMDETSGKLMVEDCEVKPVVDKIFVVMKKAKVPYMGFEWEPDSAWTSKEDAEGEMFLTDGILYEVPFY